MLVAIPPTIEDAAARFQYITYSALTPQAREHHAKGDDVQAFAVGPDGSLVVKSLTRKGNHAIEETDWNLVSHIAVTLTRKYYDNVWAAALEAHNQIVQELAVDYGWVIAREYDVRQREILAAEFQHDISTLDARCLSTIAIRAQIWLVQQHPTGQLFPLATPDSGLTLGKRAPQHDQAPVQPKRARASGSCFRCRRADHLPTTCMATTTTAGKPALALDTNSRSPNALLTSDGRSVCFAWSARGHCRFGAQCHNNHSCSICGNQSHGASACNHA